jgi:hypothetical protein
MAINPVHTAVVQILFRLPFRFSFAKTVNVATSVGIDSGWSVVRGYGWVWARSAWVRTGYRYNGYGYSDDSFLTTLFLGGDLVHGLALFCLMNPAHSNFSNFINSSVVRPSISGGCSYEGIRGRRLLPVYGVHSSDRRPTARNVDPLTQTERNKQTTSGQ